MKIAYNPLGSGAYIPAPDYKDDIIFDLVGKVIYAKGVSFDGTKYNTFKKHTSPDDTGGSEGLVPIPSYSTTNTRLLREDGQWVNIAGAQAPDETLDTSSTNTVENRVVATKINEIESKLTLKAEHVYKNIIVNEILLQALGVNDTLTFLKGDGIALIPNETDKSITISTRALGLLGINITYSSGQLVAKVEDTYYNRWNETYNWYRSVTDEDTDVYINKWQEIVDFLNNVQSGTDITDEFVTRKTALTITGEKTFRLKNSTNFIVGSSSDCPKIQVNTTGGWARAVIFTNTNDSNSVSEFGVLGYGTGINYAYIGVEDLTYSNPTFKVYKSYVTAPSFKTDGGTSSQFVKGDGSLDSTSYATSASLGNYVTIATALTISGIKTFSSQLKFTVANGTAPFTVTSNTKVANLNTDLWDGMHYSASFINASDINWSTLMWAANSDCSDVSSMSYAAVMNVGTGLYRGWLIWNSRNNHTLYWRPAKSDASTWADVHVLLDNYNYSTYLDDRYYTETEINNKFKEYLPLSGGTMLGSIVMPNSTYIYGVNESGGGMLFFDGTRTVLGSIGTSSTSNTHIRSKNATVTVSANNTASYIILHSGNYNSYAPTLTGTGASGTWGINISGNAATATKVYINNSSNNSTFPVIFTNTGSCGTPRNDSLYVDTASGAGYNPNTNAFVANIMTAGIHNSTSTLYLDSGTATTSIIFRIGSTEIARFAQPNGYLGINTTTITYPLTVNGVASATRFIASGSNQYRESGGIILNNSDIWGLNAIYTLDLADAATEGYLFKRTNGNYDSLWCKDGIFYFSPNGNSTDGYGSNYTVLHTGNYSTFLDSRYYTESEADSRFVNVTGDTMTGRLTMTNAGIIVTTNTSSNYKAGIEFYKGTTEDTTSTYDAQIGWHNTGDTYGAITILPYATSTQPWGGTVGLYISKTRLLYNGSNIINSENYTSYLGYIGTTAVLATSATLSLTGIGSINMAGDIIIATNGDTGTRQIRLCGGSNDFGRIAVGATASNAGWMEIATADDGTEPIYVRLYSGTYTTIKRTATLLDANGNTSFPGSVTAGQFIANNSAGPHFTGTSTAGNWAYLRLNNSSTYWDIATKSTSGSGGLWLARLNGADNGIFVSTGNNVGISTSAPADKLHVNGGYVRSVANDKYLRIGPQNASHAHYETDANTSHWFNKRVDVNGAIWRYDTNYGIASDGYFYAKGVYANRDGSQTLGGISLYSNTDPMTYGIAFRGTGTYGTHGYVSAANDWATYLTMNDSTTRGWIFRRGSTNIFSIAGSGDAYANGLVNATRFNSRVATGTQPYACTSTTLNTNLNADLLDGLHWSSFARYYSASFDTDPTAKDVTSTSITDFLTRLNYCGLFNNGLGACRGSWWYVGNTLYSTGVGTLEMAGTAVLNISASTGAGEHSKTLLFIEGSTGNLYSYVKQSNGYNAIWSRYAKTSQIPVVTDYYWANVKVSASSSTSTSPTFATSYATTHQSSSLFYLKTSDATMKIYANVSNSSSYGNEGVAIQTAFDALDPATSNYPSSYPARAVLQLLPRGGNIAIGRTTANSYKVEITGSLYASSWLRTGGATGWYSESYGGGWYMTDSTWLRNYGSKPLYMSVSTYPSIVCNALTGSEANIRFEIAGVNKGYTGYKSGYGTFLWNSTASKYVYIADSGYFYTQSYINVGAGNEKNASSPPYVWGVNGSDNFMRTYATSSLSVGSAAYATSSPAMANYGGTGSTTKIKIKINSTTSWMLSFVVTIYQGYKSSKIMVSGYNYGSNYWYEPEAVLLGDSNGATSISVYFGYDSAWNLWVGFDGGSYTGVSISDVTNGYTLISSLRGLFTISNVSSLSTIQKTVTATNSVNYAVSATNIYVNQHTGNNVEYPLVWSNLNNTSSSQSNLLYKSYSHLTYNPSNLRITVANILATKHINIGYSLGHVTTNRAELSLISTGAYPVDFMLGADSAKYWSITARNSADGTAAKGFGIYDYTATAYRFLINSSGNVGIGTTSPSQKLHVNGNAIATNFGVNSTAGSGQGISLYGGSGYVANYGIAFVTTANWSTHGYVTSDWATYFTMSNTANRGWIFRRSGSGNVFSIDTSGLVYANGRINGNYYTSRVATGTQPYACTSTTLNTNLNADLLDGYHRSNLFTSYVTWMEVSGLNKSITVGGDANTYYPVVITMPTSKIESTRISVWKNLGSTTPSYSGNHSNGTSSLWLIYEGRNWYWDGNGGFLKTWYKYQGYATLIAHAEQAGAGVGNLVLYLRGGGCLYNIACSNSFSVTVYTASTNLGSSTYPVNVAPRTTIGNGGILSSTVLGYGNISGNASTATLASTVTVTNSDSNSTYRMVWHSGNSLYSTAGIYCNPSSDYLYATSMLTSSWFRSTGATGWYSQTYGGGIYMEDSTWVRTYGGKNFYCSAIILAGGRIYTGYDAGVTNSISCSNWFRSNGNTGWYNPTNNCHVYPNATTTYGGLMLRGEKGGYTGFILGTSTSYMNVMSTDTHHGLYCENTGQWEFYYNRSSKGAGILTSTLTKTINLAGQTYISSNTWIGTTSGSEMLNVGGWVGTTGSGGWYSISYGGGWYMSDSTWIRTYGSKSVYLNTGQIRTDGYLVTNGGLTAGATSPNNGTYKIHCTGSTYTSGNFVPGGRLTRGGSSQSWINGRNGALVWQSSYTGYNPCVSMKTTNGAWTMGVYSSDVMYFTYTTDTNYSAGTNTATALVYINSSGYVYAPHFYESSDISLKTNIQSINDSDNIPKLRKFNWKDSGEIGYGFIALELEEQGYPELISNEGGETKTVHYSAALSLTVAKLLNKIAELEKEIENLKNKN